MASEVSSEEAGAGPKSPLAEPASLRGPRTAGPGPIKPHAAANDVSEQQLSRPAVGPRGARLRASLLAACGGDEAGGDPGAGNPDVEGDRLRRRRSPSAPAPLATLYANGDALLDGGADAFERAARDAARPPGGGQQVGLVVRAVPARVPRSSRRVSAERGDRGRLPRRERQRLAAPRPRPSSSELPLPYPSFSDPDEEIADELGLRGLLPRDRLLRPQRRARLHHVRGRTPRTSRTQRGHRPVR